MCRLRPLTFFPPSKPLAEAGTDSADAAYVVRRDPSWRQPLTVAFGAVTVMATLIGIVATR